MPNSRFFRHAGDWHSFQWLMLCGAALPLSVLVCAAPASAADDTAGTGSVSLPTLSVQAQQETATGHVQGFVAQNAASASKTNTPLLETPMSVSVVTRDQMDAQGAHTLNEVLRYTAGVQPETRGGDGSRYDLLTVRGFTPTFYLDGLRLQTLNYIQPQIDSWLLERVDVLKGPSSTLYGQAAPGGMVNQVSKLPTLTPIHEVGLETGNFGHVQGRFDIGGPIDKEGKFLFRVAGIGRTEDGLVDHTRNERIAIAPSLTWRPDADTTLTLMAFYQYDPRAGSYNSVPPEGSVLPNPSHPSLRLQNNFYAGDLNYERFNRTQTSVGYRFERRLSDIFTVRMNGRWFHTDQEYNSVYSNGFIAPDYTMLQRGIAGSRDTLDSFTIDNQLEARFSTGPVSHTVLAGFDYQRADGWYNSGFGTGPALNILNPDYYLPVTPPPMSMTRVNADQYGLYVQDQIRLNNLIVSLAGREDMATSTTSTATSVQSQFDRHFSGRAGIMYVLDNGIAPYFNYAESFLPQLGAGQDGKAFQPETGRQYELGVKYQPPGTRSLFTIAGFDLTRSNVIMYDASGAPHQNGAARSRGLELEAKFTLTDRLNVVAAYTYLDTAYTNAEDNGALAGKLLPGIPHNAASAFAYYSLHNGPLSGLSLGAGVRYLGSSLSADNTISVPDATLFDMTLNYKLGAKIPSLGGAELYVNMQNMFDRRYITACYYGSWCGFGYGRRLYAGINYRW